MNRVIGGEFPIDAERAYETLSSYQQDDNEKINVYSCGRAALYVILKHIQHRNPNHVKILVPNYICNSVTQTILDAKMNFDFYMVNHELEPDIESIYEKTDANPAAIILVNYFGLLDLSETVSILRKNRKNIEIIIDDVQNFYGFGSEECDYAFTSYRKWFPVPDGATVKIKDESKDILEQFKGKNEFSQYKFMGNLSKSFSPYIEDEFYLKMIEKGESILESSYKCMGSKISQALMKCENFAEDARIRCRNAEVLHDGLLSMGIQHKYSNSVPLFVPVFLPPEWRNEVRKTCSEHNIFLPIHWPHISDSLNGINTLYEKELSIVCDQRYTEDDMKLILEMIASGYKNCK